nr:MAG TPA: hypothetical protein [Caudoviricetes sp.]
MSGPLLLHPLTGTFSSCSVPLCRGGCPVVRQGWWC